MEGMALEEPFCSQESAFEHSVFLDCLPGVNAAARIEPALAAKEGGKNELITPNDQKRQIFHRLRLSSNMRPSAREYCSLNSAQVAYLISGVATMIRSTG